jgi:long-subunit fatty acid transport protein
MLLLVTQQAFAYPFLAPRPVPDAIAGAADPHVAASFYNPAALGPLRGFHFWMDGAARINEGSIQRDPVEGVGRGSSRIDYSNFDAFIGATYDAGTDTVTFGLSTMVPYSDLTSFNDPAVHYSTIKQAFVDYQQSFAVSLKISPRLFVGVGANFVESWMRWSFDRDLAPANGNAGIDAPNGLCGVAPCGLENPAARQRLDLRGFGSGWSVSMGVLGRPADRLWLALSYTTHSFNFHGSDELQLVDERGTTVTVPQGSAILARQGNQSVSIYLPDLLQAAARVEVTSRAELEANLRYIHYGERSQLLLEMQGGGLGQLPPGLAVPPTLKRDLGLQDTFGIEVSARFRVGDKWRLSPSLFFETSAVEPSAVNAAAMDAPKLDFALTAEWRPVKHLVLGAHVGGTAYLFSHVDSRQNSRDLANCVDARYSLEWCGPVNSGDGWSSASGKYTLFVVHLGGAVGVDY